MIKLRALKERENLSEIIPEIIKAFDENSKEEVVQFTGSAQESYEIRRFDMKVYQAISIPKLQADYFYFLVQRYSCMQCNDPVLFAELLQVCYKMTCVDAQNDYLAHINSKIS